MTPVFRRAAEGHTFVELVVALSLTAACLGALYSLRISTPDPLVGGSGETSREMLELHGRIHRLVSELQEGTRLFYPVAGKGIHPGLGFVDARGTALLYYVEPKPGTSVSRLFRVDLNRDRKVPSFEPTPFIDDVVHFRVSVAPAEPGKEPSLAHLGLAVRVTDLGRTRTRTLDYVTAAFLRNLERHVPDDLFPAGTPLADP